MPKQISTSEETLQSAFDASNGGRKKSDKLPTFGFVVIGRDEGSRLLKCLRSLRLYSMPIVYADSCSIDGSRELACENGADVILLDSRLPKCASRGRAEGAERLLFLNPQIEFIQFIDGDCELQSGWMESALTFLSEQPSVAVTCGRRFEARIESVYDRLCNEEWNTPIGRTTACGGDALMRVSAYRAAGGFRPDIMAGEEPELCARLRQLEWQIWRLDDLMTEHEAGISRIGQWMRRSVRGGFGYAQVWRLTGQLPQRLFARQLKSAFLWALAVPGIVACTAVATHQPTIVLLVPVAYALQITRLAGRESFANRFSWQKAILIMTAKFSEAFGAIQYWSGLSRSLTFRYKD